MVSLKIFLGKGTTVDLFSVGKKKNLSIILKLQNQMKWQEIAFLNENKKECIFYLSKNVIYLAQEVKLLST